MPDLDGNLSIGLDFDGSLVEDRLFPFRWRKGAREFVVGAAAAGLKLWLHSCRCTPVGVRELPGDAEDFWRAGRVPDDVETSWRLREEMVAFLKAEGVWGLVSPWDAPGKPICDYYADDRAELPDWIVIAGEIGVRLAYGDRPSNPSALGEQRVAPDLVPPTPESASALPGA